MKSKCLYHSKMLSDEIRSDSRKLFPGKVAVLFMSLAFFLSGMISVYAQDSLLSFETAARISLENNFEIRIATNEQIKLTHLDSPGDAGMLPELYLNGAYSNSDNSTRQNYSSGEQVDRKNVGSENMNAEVALSWTIFDGLKMFSTRKKLAELSSQGSVTLKIKMEEVYLMVIRSYYEISRQQQLLRSIQEEIQLANERLIIAERRFNNGSGSKLDMLHAKTDLNARRSAEMTQKSILEASSIDLNRLLALPADTKYRVEDSVRITYHPSLNELTKQSEVLNSVRSYHRKQLTISKLSLKESGGKRWPEIKLNGNYLFSRTENEAGFMLLNRNQGFNYGISASLPLFNGFRISHEVKNARLEVLNAGLKVEQVDQEIKAGLLIAYRNYQDDLAILKLEEENIIASKEILLISQERFKSGLSGIVELKDTQRSYEEAMNRLVDARFNAKMAESNLKQLAGELIR